MPPKRSAREDRTAAVVKKSRAGYWLGSTVYNIAKNTTYQGIWHYGNTKRVKRNGKTIQEPVPKEEWIAVDVPAIIEVDVWHEAQRQLTLNRRQARCNVKHDYLLRGMIRCSCGRNWWGAHVRKKSGSIYHYYRCRTKTGDTWLEPCGFVGGIGRSVLEDAVWQTIVHHILDPDHLRRELKRQRTDAGAAQQRHAARLQAVGDSLDDVDRKLGLLLDGFLGDFPPDVVAERKQLLLRQREVLAKEKVRLQTEVQAGSLSPKQEETILDFAARIRTHLTEVGFAEKRRILEVLQVEVEIVSKTEIKVSALICLEKATVVPGGDGATSTENGLLVDSSSSSQTRWRARKERH